MQWYVPLTTGYVWPTPRQHTHVHQIEHEGVGGPKALDGIDINTQGLTTKPLHVGDQIVIYLSGSLEAGSPVGNGYFGPFPDDYELDVSLTCDLSADPTIKITEENSNE
jgi:hypothetical protein